MGLPQSAPQLSAACLIAAVVALTARSSYAFVLKPVSPICSCLSPAAVVMCSNSSRRSSSIGTGTAITMTAHRHHLHEEKLPGSSDSNPIITATGKATQPPPPADTEGAVSLSKRRRRRRPIIGPAVWAAFKEEQRGVTRTLLGLPDEADGKGKATPEVEAAAAEAGAEAAPAGQSGGRNHETIEVELQRRRQEEELKKQQRRPVPRTTLGTFMTETRSRSPDMEPMVPIMKSVGKTCVAVSRLVRRAQIEGMAGLHQAGRGSGAAAAESVNVQGEVQKELDVLSNSIFLTGFCQPADMSGEYAAVFDPLDGSANIEAGLPCGTIFGILRVSGSAREGKKAGPSTIVLPGRRLVAAGYCLYGPSTKLVFTLGAGVFEFTLLEDGAAARSGGERGGRDDGGLGGGGLEFVLTRSNMKIPRSGNIYSVNEANSVSWSEAIQDYFRDLKKSMAIRPSPAQFSSSASGAGGGGAAGGGEQEAVRVEGKYAGALVADIHNILVHGGVFAYPADVRNPNGKLRLLYEGNPIAMIVEEAGGVATTGFEAIRDVRPQSVHHRIPAFFGSPDDLLPLLDPRYLHSKQKRR